MRLLGHAEIDAVVLDVHVELLEAAFVEQHLEPLARGQLALGVLRIDALLAPAHPRGGAAAFEFCDVGGQGDPLECYALVAAVTLRARREQGTRDESAARSGRVEYGAREALGNLPI